jgi:hypothetical protein
VLKVHVPRYWVIQIISRFVSEPIFGFVISTLLGIFGLIALIAGSDKVIFLTIWVLAGASFLVSFVALITMTIAIARDRRSDEV